MDKKFDLDAMASIPALVEAEPIPERELIAPDECMNCGGNRFDFSERQITCARCGCVQSQPIDYRDRRAFTEEQARSRSSTSATSYLSSNKNLGSIIGACKKDKQDQHVRRLLLAERKLANDVTDNELKEVIRIFTIIADSNNLGLTRREVEDLIITYRKNLLGTKISIGRPRYAVLLAFTFLELRNKHRNYLTYHEFLDKVNLSKFDKTLDFVQEQEMIDDFQSAVMYFVKEHGYKLRQPSIPSMIHHAVNKLRLPPIIGTEAIKVWKVVASYYKLKGVKNAGIVVAIIPSIARFHGVPVKKKEISAVFPGTSSTAKFRTKEIRAYLESWISRVDGIKRSPGSDIVDLVKRYLDA